LKSSKKFKEAKRPVKFYIYFNKTQTSILKQKILPKELGGFVSNKPEL
jgi:hypothetical protein